MECYWASLSEKQKKNNEYLKSSIELLKYTSLLASNFRDARPIDDTSDARLSENDTVLEWLRKWELNVNKDIKIKKKGKNHDFSPNKSRCLLINNWF